MIYSFYNGAVGAQASQNYLNIIANNMSNISTQGYKQQTASFYNLVYTNLEKNNQQGNLIKGSGAKIEHTGLNWSSGAMIPTGAQFDFAINGNGFFMVQDQTTGEEYFTRDGAFSLSRKQNGNMYLCNSRGDYILGPDKKPIEINNLEDNVNLGIFNFRNTSGLELCGNNLYKATEKSGEMYALNQKQIVQGYLEGSNVSLSDEMVSMIESQKSYQMNIRMVQTSDEIVQTINNLR